MTLSSRNGLLRHDGPAYRASRAGARGVQKTVLQGSLELIPEEGSPPVSTSSNPLNSGESAGQSRARVRRERRAKLLAPGQTVSALGGSSSSSGATGSVR